MIAIILCAGKGSRLNGMADEIPKTLLPVTKDKTILDTILDSVSPLVEHTIVVAGHCKDALIKYVSSIPDVSVHVVDDVDKYNNARSLWSALCDERVIDAKQPLLVANGDTVLHPTATRALVAESDQYDVSLATDTTIALAEEEMKVILDSDANVQVISKLVDPSLAVGEFVGQSVIAPTALNTVRAALEITWRSQPQDYYEDGYQLAVEHGVKVGVVELPATLWTEVDDQVDLSEARGLSWLS